MLSVLQEQILDYIDSCLAVTIKQLAEHFDSNYNNAFRRLNRLKHLGYLISDKQQKPHIYYRSDKTIETEE